MQHAMFGCNKKIALVWGQIIYALHDEDEQVGSGRYQFNSTEGGSRGSGRIGRVLNQAGQSNDIDTNDYVGVNAVLTAGILLSWIRTMQVMALHSKLGPLLAMIARMFTQDIIQFMTICAALLLALG